VTPVGERQFVEAILKSSYISEKRALNEREYLAHLRRFIKLLDEEPSCASLLSTFSLLFGKDNKWHKPAEIYLDWPYLDTGLGSYVDVLGTSVRLVPLADLYQHLPIDVSKVARFAERIGALSSIPLAIVPCSRNPEWRYLRGVPGERYTNPIDRDYAISRFDLLVGKKSEKLAKLVWNTMCSLAKNHDDEPTYRHNPLRAVYRKNERGGAHFADSNLVHQLRNEAWVPQRGGRFVQPTNARPELLPEGFTFDPGWPWIKAIQFGVSLHSLNAKAVADSSAAVERHRMQQEAAKTLGFDDAETARRAAKIPADEFNRFYADWERRKAIELPEHNPANPGRRTDRVSALAATAPERKTEERTRSVSVGREEVKAETDQYLRQQYTNGDADQICQICKDVLPFKLDNGTYYFEAVELLPDLQRRHVQNYLCLCPNHSAMFRHANGSRETLKKRIMQHSENEICMVLAQNDHVIYFTKTHLEDLKAIIKIDEKLFL
jgi:hypothetical protein